MLPLLWVMCGSAPPATAIAVVRLSVVDQDNHLVANATALAEGNGSAGQVYPRKVLKTGSDGSVAVRFEPGIWSIRGGEPTLWGWPTQLVVTDQGPDSSSIRLKLWPRGRASGFLRAPANDTLPTEIKVHVGRGTVSEFPKETVLETCTLERGRWLVEVPAGPRLDLEIDAPGFAPKYLWDLVVGADRTLDSATTSLFRGASVAGWVVAADGRAPYSPAQVDLTAPTGENITSQQPFPFKTTTTARGFFQLGPVPAGVYRLSAATTTQSSQPQGIRTVQGREERLHWPIELRPPAQLNVDVTPSQDPEGRPWLIRLSTKVGAHRGTMVATNEPVSSDGTWSKNGLRATEYRLRVGSAHGDTWFAKTLNLQPGPNNEAILIHLRSLQGSILIGSKPLAAHLRIRERDSATLVSLDSDANGKFSGSFPSVDVQDMRFDVQVESNQPKVRWELAGVRPDSATDSLISFSLKLPSGSIEGTVVDDTGVPVPGNLVIQLADQQRVDADVSQDLILADTIGGGGGFLVNGLKPGVYRVYASGSSPDGTRTLQSDTVSLTVDGSNPTSVLLLLKDTVVLSGTVTASGAGVPGAAVGIMPSEAPDALIRISTTDGDGHFRTRVPQEARRVSIFAGAVGVGRRTLSVEVPDDRTISVDLQPPGGNLVLTWNHPVSDDATVVIYHQHGFDTVASLTEWARQNGESSEPGVLRAPLMSAGLYRVCQTAGISDYLRGLAGTLPAGQCIEGYLWSGGELQLSVPKTARAKGGS